VFILTPIESRLELAHKMLPHVEVTEEIMCCSIHHSTLLDSAALELFLPEPVLYLPSSDVSTEFINVIQK
jgi:hypothetical protein